MLISRGQSVDLSYCRCQHLKNLKVTRFVIENLIKPFGILPLSSVAILNLTEQSRFYHKVPYRLRPPTWVKIGKIIFIQNKWPLGRCC